MLMRDKKNADVNKIALYEINNKCSYMKRFQTALNK